MAWYPGAIRKVVARHRTPMSRHRGICNHVAVSEAASLFGYFNQPGNPTSHFYVRRDGKVEQYVDTQFRAPANLEGNPSLISVETQGGVRDVDTEPWTPEQVETLASIAAWANRVHDIPLVAMRDSLPGTTGIGYHRLGVEPWRVDGGELWSSGYGKVCPGAAKIAQIPSIITRARLENTPTTGDGAMAWTDAQITQHLANQAATVDRLDELVKLIEGQTYNQTETRKNTSLTATRLGTTLGADTQAIRAATEQTAKNTTPPPEV
jgi:hypothetical protein